MPKIKIPCSSSRPWASPAEQLIWRRRARGYGLHLSHSQICIFNRILKLIQNAESSGLRSHLRQHTESMRLIYQFGASKRHAGPFISLCVAAACGTEKLLKPETDAWSHPWDLPRSVAVKQNQSLSRVRSQLN